MHIGSPPDIFGLGHRAIRELLFDFVQVEEKVDGSQFSFCRTDDGEFHARSRKQQIQVEAPGMFGPAVGVLRDLPLTPNWIYRGEYLSKPKHNVLKYDRVPTSFVIIYDIMVAQEEYLTHPDRRREAGRLGLEVVPVLYEGKVKSSDQLRTLLDTTSVLGGVKVEGIVIKNYARFGPDKKVMMAKWVREAFKEVSKESWRHQNPTSGDILERLSTQYRTTARWQKAVQHLRELELLAGEPKDIGALIHEVQADVQKECGAEIRELLFAWAWKQLSRKVVSGLPEWYKEQLRPIFVENEHDSNSDVP